MTFSVRAAAFAAVSLLAIGSPVFGASRSGDAWPFVQRVLAQNPEAQASLARADQAKAEAEALAAPLYNPSLEIGVEDKRGARGTPSAYDVGVAYTLELGGKQSARARAGGGRWAAATASDRALRNELAARTLMLLSARESAISLEENATRQQAASARLAIALARSLGAGDVGTADSALGQILSLQAEADLNSAKSQRAAIETALTTLCACRAADLPRLAVAPPDVPRLDDGALKRFAEQSLSVEAARFGVEAAEGDLDVARAGRIPDPTISLSYGNDERQSLYRLGLSVPLPLANDGSREVEAKNRAVIVAARERETALRDAYVRARTAYDTYQINLASWNAWRSNAGSNDDRIASLEALRNAGEATLTEFVVQLKESLDASKQGVAIRDAAWQAYAEWLAASSQALTLAGAN